MNILITGASSGIGYETALRFAENAESTVFVIARRSEQLSKLASESTAGKIVPVIMDLGTYDYQVLGAALDKYKIKHLDCIIHNAGYLINKPFEDLTGDDWETVYRANVIGPAQLTRFLLQYTDGKTLTHIVTIGSIGGVRGSMKFSGLSAYSSSKGALAILTECLAEELSKRNVRVNCLALGSVQTEMLTKAFPGYVASMLPGPVSRLIYEFATTGWKYFNGKILEVSTTNP